MGLEYKIESFERKLLDKVTCDRCGMAILKLSEGGWNQLGEPLSIFHEPAFEEYFTFEQHWGYHSNKDGETHRVVLCEDCYDAVFDGNDIHVHVTKYDPIGSP